MNQSKFIIIGMIAIVTAAMITSVMLMPAFAAQQSKNGSSHNGLNGTNFNGRNGQNGGVGVNGGIGSDATKGGVGENGGNNQIP